MRQLVTSLFADLRFTWDQAVVTTLVLILAVLTAWPHFVERCPRKDCFGVWHTWDKFLDLAGADSVGREFESTITEGLLKQIDNSLSLGARVYVAGVLGEADGPRLGNFFCVNYHLFPRQVGISLMETPSFKLGGWFEGRPATSDEELKASGYDLVLDFSKGIPGSQEMGVRVLTEAGTVHIPRK